MRVPKLLYEPLATVPVEELSTQPSILTSVSHCSSFRSPAPGATHRNRGVGPAVLAVQRGQQAQQLAPRPPSRFHPPEPVRDTRHHVVQTRDPSGSLIYGHKRGSLHRTITGVCAAGTSTVPGSAITSEDSEPESAAGVLVLQ